MAISPTHHRNIFAVDPHSGRDLANAGEFEGLFAFTDSETMAEFEDRDRMAASLPDTVHAAAETAGVSSLSVYFAVVAIYNAGAEPGAPVFLLGSPEQCAAAIAAAENVVANMPTQRAH